MFELKANKLIMMGYKIEVHDDKLLLATSINKVFISTLKAGDHTFNACAKHIFTDKVFIRVSLMDDRYRTTEEINIDSFGNLIHIVSEKNTADEYNGYNLDTSDYFYEDCAHWLFRDNLNKVLYYNKKLNKKAQIMLGRHTIKNDDELEIIEITPMCIILNNLYINFNTNEVHTIDGRIVIEKEFIAIITEQGSLKVESNDLANWIELKSGDMYKVTRPSHYKDYTYEAELYGINMRTGASVCKTYTLKEI